MNDNSTNDASIRKTNINWFPGHMAKARREMSEHIKLVDMIIEIRDARIPASSQNPLLNELALNKPRLIILSKADKAQKEMTQQFIACFKKQGYSAMALDLIRGKNIGKTISDSCEELMKEKITRLKAKGLRNYEIKAMVVGIPNVGKSTLINSVSARKIAKTADHPGVTKSLQWIKVSSRVALLDTPGVLWPKFEDQQIAYRLSVTGAINDNVLPLHDICDFAIGYLKENYPEKLKERYNIEPMGENHEIIDAIAKTRGWMVNETEVNYERTYALLLKEIRDNQLSNITWEKCNADTQ